MASTYTWADAISYVKPFVKQIPTTTLDVLVCDQTNSTIWKAFPWRWAVFSLTSSTGQLDLVDGTQDYSIGTTTAGGFYQLLRVRITRTDITPNVVREKDIVQWLAPNVETQASIDTLQAIAPLSENLTTGLRLDSAASVASGTSYRIDGEYWAQPVKITATSATITFPDQYFNVVLECLKWKYYQLGDDKRAAQQYAVFNAALKTMIDDEDFGEGMQQRFPGDVLGAGKAGNPGLYGWGY